MPFTLSHAAVVLPFSRPLARWGVLSAALIGSMIPDSRYFLPWRTHHFETHSVGSLFTYALPWGLLVYWLFEYLVKLPLIELLPDGAYARWAPYESPASIRSLRQWLFAACGVLGGAFSHLVWDAFTHEGARGMRMSIALAGEEPIFDFGSHHLAFGQFLQDLSSLVGLVAVIAMICYGLRAGGDEPIPTRRLESRERRRWTWSVLLISALIFCAFLAYGRWLNPFPLGITTVLYDIAIASLRALATAVIMFTIALQVRLRAPDVSPGYPSSGPER